MIQKLKNRFDADDRAVSPVIGVILMVAITVILAAVIASLTLGLGDSAQTTPQVKYDHDYAGDFVSGTSSDALTLNHQSGATVDSGRLHVVVTGAQKGGSDVSLDTSSLDTSGDGEVQWDELDGSADASVTSGDSIALEKADFTGSSGELDLSGATVKLVWTSEDGGSSSTVYTWEA